jgi:hypothetical protein
MTIKMALSAIILLGLITTTCVSAWMSAMQTARPNQSQCATIAVMTIGHGWEGPTDPIVFSRRRK